MAAGRLCPAVAVAHEDVRHAQFRTLITRPTEHSGVTFGAATSDLLTGGVENYLQGRHKKGVVQSVRRRNVETPQERVANSSAVP